MNDNIAFMQYGYGFPQTLSFYGAPANIPSSSVNQMQLFAQPIIQATGMAPGNFMNQTNAQVPFNLNSWMNLPTMAQTQATVMPMAFLANTMNNADSFLSSATTQQNGLLYSLLNAQTQIAGDIGKQAGDALNTAANKISKGGKGGLLGFFGF